MFKFVVYVAAIFLSACGFSSSQRIDHIENIQKFNCDQLMYLVGMRDKMASKYIVENNIVEAITIDSQLESCLHRNYGKFFTTIRVIKDHLCKEASYFFFAKIEGENLVIFGWSTLAEKNCD